MVVEELKTNGKKVPKNNEIMEDPAEAQVE
jgi:hypothetical protein